MYFNKYQTHDDTSGLKQVAINATYRVVLTVYTHLIRQTQTGYLTLKKIKILLSVPLFMHNSLLYSNNGVPSVT
jgi:hypothetical protein